MAKQFVPGQLGLFKPDSAWTRPTELPDLRGRKLVAIDSETKDDGLANNLGPGWALGPMGYICGISWATEGSVGYAPTRHPETDNFPLENVLRWLDDLFKSGTRIVFHNGPYDIGWFGSFGVAPPVNFEDTLPACVLLDEGNRRYSLDACCERAGIPGKDTTLLKEAIRAYGGNPNKGAADLWRVPAKYAAPYAEQDGVATLSLWNQSEGALKAQDVWNAYRTEIDLIPMTVAMRRRGIRVNTGNAIRVGKDFRTQRDIHLKTIGDVLGLRRAATLEEIRNNKFMVRHCEEAGIKPPRTESGKSFSFSKDWMEKHPNPFPRAVTQALKFEDAASKFIDNFILGFTNRGRIHAEVHQFLSEDGGTRSHRFSYSEPPLQQMSSPDKDPRDENKNLILDQAIGTKVRQCFEPEKGEAWLASDYSQQEPRITVHFAAACRVAGVDEALERYRNNPRTDYHTMVADMTGLPRPRAKILNLAMTYGKGKESTAEELGVTIEEADDLLKMYHAKLPFIKALESLCKNRASSRGFIRLIDGARMHYNEWEGPFLSYEVRNAAKMNGHSLAPCSYEEAIERQRDDTHPWHGKKLRRADTRKSLNNLVQGSAARQTKRAMLEMWREGITPLIQMHDEVGASIQSREQVQRIAQIMIETTPLLVPTIVDSEVGPTWGDAKMTWDAYADKYLRAA